MPDSDTPRSPFAGMADLTAAPDYGEYAINTMLGPAIDKTRSPFDIRSDAGDEDIGNCEAVMVEPLQSSGLAVTEAVSLMDGTSAEGATPAGGVLKDRETPTAI